MFFGLFNYENTGSSLQSRRVAIREEKGFQSLVTQFSFWKTTELAFHQILIVISLVFNILISYIHSLGHITI
jgi:hypothetical protein